MNWTDERVEKLKKLWSEGLSASQIAAQLGGVSRAAIRQGPPPQPPGPRQDGRHADRDASQAPGTRHAAPRQFRRPARAGPRRRPAECRRRAAGRDRGGFRGTGRAASRGGQCQQRRRAHVAPAGADATHRTHLQMAIGDPLNDDFHFCGNESPDNSPYCTYHQRLAYQPSAERRRMR